MGYLITSVSATERNYLWEGDFSMPQLSYTDGLVGLYVLGTSDAMSCRNFANPSLPLLVVGSPDYSGDGAVVGPGGYFDTQLPSTPDMTFVAVVNKDMGGSLAPVISNLTNAADLGTTYNRGDSLVVAIAGTSLNVRTYRDREGTINGPYQGNIVSRSLGGWAAVAVRFNGSNNSDEVVLGQQGENLSVIDSALNNVRSGLNRSLLIGRTPNGDLPQSCRVRMVAIYNTLPSSEQLASLVDDCRTNFGPSVGITTL